MTSITTAAFRALPRYCSASLSRVVRPLHCLPIAHTPPQHALIRPGFRPASASVMATTDAAAPTSVRIALCQILCGTDKAANVRTASTAVEAAASGGAQIVCLPECFNSPYATDQFPVYAEPIPATAAELRASDHPTTHALSELAARTRVYLVGGSIPERDADGRVYNTCVAFDPTGAIVARHRKVHLFDIDVPGRITFKESETLSAGSRLSFFDTPYGRVGLGICYDIRFPLYAMSLRAEGCSILIYPGAFNMTTGPAHWELLARARAIDTQSYVCVCSPARNPEGKYTAWGHSSIISPWAEVLATTEEGPSTVVADLPLARVAEVRASIPVSVQARRDLYSLSWTGPRE